MMKGHSISTISLITVSTYKAAYGLACSQGEEVYHGDDTLKAMQTKDHASFLDSGLLPCFAM